MTRTTHPIAPPGQTPDPDLMPAEASGSPPLFVHRLLLTLAVAAGLAVLVAAFLLARREAEKLERVWAEQERRLAETVPFGKVKGVVTLDGQPLGTVEVAFLPDPERGTCGATANCYTDAQGRYALRTEKEDRDGAMVGHHRVIVIDVAALSSPGGTPGAGREPAQNRVPPDYSDPLRLEVKPGQQTVNLEIVTPEPEPNQ